MGAFHFPLFVIIVAGEGTEVVVVIIILKGSSVASNRIDALFYLQIIAATLLHPRYK